MNYDRFIDTPPEPDDTPLLLCPDCGKYTRDILDHYTRRCQPKGKAA